MARARDIPRSVERHQPALVGKLTWSLLQDVPGRLDLLEKNSAPGGGGTRQAGQNDEDAWRANVQQQLDRLQDSLAQSQVS